MQMARCRAHRSDYHQSFHFTATAATVLLMSLQKARVGKHKQGLNNCMADSTHQSVEPVLPEDVLVESELDALHFRAQ